MPVKNRIGKLTKRLSKGKKMKNLKTLDKLKVKGK